MFPATLTVHFHERYGAFDRIVSLLRRRGFPLTGMTVERTHRPEVGRMTLTVGDEAVGEQVRCHLGKLPDVRDVTLHRTEDAVHREFAMLRLRCWPDKVGELRAVLAAYGGSIVSLTPDHVVVEASGGSATLDALFQALQPFGIEESARTSPLALQRISADA